MTNYEPDARDPGLAAERTDLAWDRSGLSLLACGALILRGIGESPLVSPNVALGTFVLALGIVTWLLGAWHASHSRRRGRRRTTLRDLMPIALGVALVGIAALIVGGVHG